MNLLIENPITIWLSRKIKSMLLEYRNSHLKIGYMSLIKRTTFGIYNTIYNHVYLNEVELGDFTYIANNTQIHRTTLGKFVSIGRDCKIGLAKHPTSQFVSTHPIFFSPSKQCQISFADQSYFPEYGNIDIGNDVWVGDNVIIVNDVTIGDGSIIAAGSVVTKDVPPYAIVGGVPARIIKYRFDDSTIEKLLRLKWWDNDISHLKNNYKNFHDIKLFMKLYDPLIN